MNTYPAPMHRMHFAPVTEETAREAAAIDAADDAATAALETPGQVFYGLDTADDDTAEELVREDDTARELFISTVPARELARHRRLVHRHGGVIVMSSPVAAGYLVTWCYRVQVSA